MKMKLLNKSIVSYLLYATLVLIFSIPVLYIAIQQIVSEEVDESLVQQKEKIISKLYKIKDVSSFSSLEDMDLDISLLLSKSNIPRKDSLYNIIVHNEIEKEETPYRVLESDVTVNDKIFTLKLRNSLLDSKDLIESIVKIIAILLLFIIAGLTMINRLLSRKLWKPFYNSINKLKEFKIEENEIIEFEENNIIEFTDLNKAITELTKRSSNVYQSQKEFTENASHEMQTPLAVLQGKLDLLMQTNPLSKEQSELIGDLADVNQKMNYFNRSLLLLTKIENNQFGENEKISIKLVIEKTIEQFCFQVEQKNITVTNECNDDMIINANKALIEIMISNLFSNAIKHNTEGGRIHILLNNNKMIIENTGNKTSLDVTRLFQRFQKQTIGISNTGLGLEIVKKIATLNYYTIEYTFTNKQHTFTLSFK